MPWRRLAAVAVVLVLLLGATMIAVRRQTDALKAQLGPHERTTITQSVVVERMRAVARLVTSETMVRDVVTYENTWYGSTKRSIVVVTGRIDAGVNLERGTQIDIDEATKTIALTLPKAEILSVDVTDMKTYDERGGLWNPFTPADRDAIIRIARNQLGRAAYEMKVIEHAEQNASTLLAGLFRADGYTTTVTFAPRLETTGPR
ncbi:MAG: DUF4230 domain-containing protein [Gemmatimonadaceae bacterium]|nr:DUF4230 domain-containing protein [Gemmatimonadaceae bacterium]NUR17959.1 DUF4230 domain-containing protein [Gemmatimonadaceae bacterium]NUS98143.1 DUF4230 domain-containing protein [Gemmatimonadaceae bacterium]